MAENCSYISECQTHFGTSDLYVILNLPSGKKADLSAAEVKRAYYKASLKWHPDRASSEGESNKENATKKFQIISKAYKVLSDKERKAVYDETGVIDDDEISVEGGKDWAAYWRLLFKTVTAEDIQKFSDEYKGSEEERSDLKEAYLKHEGDMEAIIDSVYCANVLDDEARFRKIIQELIDAGEIRALPKFSGECKIKAQKRKRRAEKEAVEAEEALRAIKKKEGFSADGDADLRSMILSRQSNREAGMKSLIDNLEAKYGASSKKPAGKRGAKKK